MLNILYEKVDSIQIQHDSFYHYCKCGQIKSGDSTRSMRNEAEKYNNAVQVRYTDVAQPLTMPALIGNSCT